MTRVLIVGYGNPLRRDDGFGWYAAQAFAEQCNDAEIEIIGCHQLTYELAEPLSRAHYAIFIDAAAEDVPGRLVIRVLEPEHLIQPLLSHHASPWSLLASARELYGTGPKQVLLFSVGANDFGYAEDLSPCLAKMIPIVLDRVRVVCEDWKSRAVTEHAHRALA